MSPDKGRSRSGGTGPDRAPAGEWTLRPAGEQARKEWETAVQSEPELMQRERERLVTRPLDRSDNPRRTAQLKAGLSHRLVGGKRLPQWQREVTSGGRLWYCPDKDARVVWIVKVDLGHPSETA